MSGRSTQYIFICIILKSCDIDIYFIFTSLFFLSSLRLIQPGSIFEVSKHNENNLYHYSFLYRKRTTEACAILRMHLRMLSKKRLLRGDVQHIRQQYGSGIAMSGVSVLVLPSAYECGCLTQTQTTPCVRNKEIILGGGCHTIKIQDPVKLYCSHYRLCSPQCVLSQKINSENQELFPAK